MPQERVLREIIEKDLEEKEFERKKAHGYKTRQLISIFIGFICMLMLTINIYEMKYHVMHNTENIKTLIRNQEIMRITDSCLHAELIKTRNDIKLHKN